MSNADIRTTRLGKNQARKMVSEIVNKYPANVFYSKHALEELADDGLTTVDVLNIIKSGSARIDKQPEFDDERNSWKYRLETNNITVVLSFSSETSFVVITAWRNHEVR